MNSDQFHATISEELEVTDQKCRSQNKDWSTAKRWEYDNIKSDQFHATISEETESELTLDLSESNDSEGGSGGGYLWQATTDMFQRHHNDPNRPPIRPYKPKHNRNYNQQRTSKQSVLNIKSMSNSQDMDKDEVQDTVDMMPPMSSTELYLTANNNEKTNSYIHDIMVTSSSGSNEMANLSMHASTSLSNDSMNMSIMIQSFD